MVNRNRFWDSELERFDEVKFIELIEEIIVVKSRGIMMDLSRLQSAVDAQDGIIASAQSKIQSQGARIVDLEAQLAAAGGGDQAAIDALAVKLESHNTTLAQASA